jgi:type IV pilus assembly protein PilA
MRCVHILAKGRCNFINFAITTAAIFLIPSHCSAQPAPAGQQSESPWLENLKKHPELLAEFGRLVEKLRLNVQFPPARAESRLLPLLPESTMVYAAFSNYGDAADQTLRIFRQELQDSDVLRDWWKHGEVAANGPKIEIFLDKFDQLHQFLGDEIVVSGAMAGQNPSLLVVAEVRKPGLKKFLEEMAVQIAGKAKPGVRVLDPKELAAAVDEGPGQELAVLVRPDFVAAAFDVATLRKFNARLERGGAFVSTPFGKRIIDGYQGGVTVLAAADLQKILSQTPPSMNQNATFQHSGFAEMKYLVWEHKKVAGQDISETVLSFIGARRGPASWLGKPAPLGGLDFVSPKAMTVASVVLANPAQTFEDVRELGSSPNSNPFAALEMFEKGFKLSVKDDLLSLLGGELTFELDSITPPQPAWRAMLRVNDASHLQRTLTALLAAMHFEVQQADDGGVTYYTAKIPSGKTATQIGYAFVDGYLVVGSSPDVVAEAVALHKSGGSLAKSKKFLASLPPGHGLEASALIYQDPIAMAALSLRQMAPDMADSLAQVSGEVAPAVLCVYGEETAIREQSTSPAFDAGAVLVVAAIAIPNLLRSRIAANESSAVGSIRSVNTAQIVYDSTYKGRGFAPNLAALGADPQNPKAQSVEHAGLLDPSLANESCAGDGWCTKSGYRFRVVATCKQHHCQEFVVVATPVDSNTGTRSFCSTSDLEIHYKSGPPLTAPVSASECKAWPLLQ